MTELTAAQIESARTVLVDAIAVDRPHNAAQYRVDYRTGIYASEDEAIRAMFEFARRSSVVAKADGMIAENTLRMEHIDYRVSVRDVILKKIKAREANPNQNDDAIRMACQFQIAALLEILGEIVALDNPA
jgi:hypothetical protein